MENRTAKRILLIEDSTIFRKILKERLESNGYRTIEAMDGLEGFSLARKEKPDLIILDLFLPKADGHRICRFIKFDRNLCRIPVIMMTSRDLEKDADLAKCNRADAFIVKTIRVEIVLDVIKQLLDKYEKQTEENIFLTRQAESILHYE